MRYENHFDFYKSDRKEDGDVWSVRKGETEWINDGRTDRKTDST